MLGGGVVSTSELDERLNRALTVYLRQEVQAPATAVTEFLDMIIEDARGHKLDHMLSDLERMHGASVRLNTFVKGLIDNSASDRKDDETPEAFHKRLRHDLRTPLNAIIGYSELLMEDTEADDNHPLRGDLVKLKQSADYLLSQIDAMVALTQDKAFGREKERAPQLDVIADVLRTVAPLKSDAEHGKVRASDILVVDDNASNRDVLARRLTREGHRVVTAESGARALDFVAARDFDLILLDLIMPEMSGFEVLRRLKTAERTVHVPVIIISALDELDSVVRCIEAGAEDYLAKPFDPTLLRARINASLERKLLRDREKKFIADLEQEKRRSETLLLNILPQSIVQRMREGETAIADRISQATILFCDLVGFTALSQDLSADLVIDFLSRIFSTFDKLAAEQGVEKIKTIGDSYMVASGIPEHQDDHAFRIAALSLRMMAAVDTIARDTKLKLEARIGIHSGPVVAGVIGTHKFVYDVWGDTVNTASRMESHSLTGRIQVSAVTRFLLGDHFKFESRGMIEIKGKSPMETYFLLGAEAPT
jgi:class 3 adenylate cyclase/CheY-like chemotaxis protein